MATLVDGGVRRETVARVAAGRTGPVAGARLTSIDALRGLVMAIMLIDHVRETFLLHLQVSDPMDARATMPALFFTRSLSMICAPVFVALAGVSAWLYGQAHGARAASAFLLKRGLFLMALEVTVVGFAWSPQIPPQTLWLQVIWAIGVAMVVLAALIHLPRAGVIAVGVGIVAGHNLLDGIAPAADDGWFAPWAMLHRRAAFEWMGLTVKTTYPVLAWIGVIALGYGIGPWFADDGGARRRRLAVLGAALLAGFAVLRIADVYGDASWSVVAGDPLRSVMSALALTKYPPSLLFLMLTLGVGALLLAGFERLGDGGIARRLAVLGGAPMFFYLLHLYVLRALYLGVLAAWGPNRGAVFGVASIGWVWAIAALLIVALYPPTRWFAGLKRRRRDLAWLRYF